MSINKAMWTGVSGLAAESQALGVVGDNIANSNTLGFKMSRALFEDVLGGAVGQNLGGGVRMNRPQQIFSQGTMMNTGQATDLALTGDGFFVVNGSLGGVQGSFYTRAGNFNPDANGILVNAQGLHVQGYGVNPDGSINGKIGDIQLPTGPLPAKATPNVEIDANLDASQAVDPIPFDPTAPSTTSDYSSPMVIYDSLGGEHQVDVYYKKTADNTWDYHVLVDGAELDPAQVGNVQLSTGSLSFDPTTGGLPAPPAASFTATFAGGAAPNQTVTLDFGSGGMDGLTQVVGGSINTFISKEGYASGTLSGVNVEPDGTVMGVYSNGEELAVAQLAIAKFASNQGLARAGQNSWAETRGSGEATLGAAGTGGRGPILAGALEQSNVDIAGQFVAMISHQRSFQANSKTITTADEMMQEIVNLKR